MKTTEFRPQREISGHLYQAVLDFALAEHVAEALLVVRDEPFHLGPSAKRVLAQLEPSLRRRAKARSWPGTQLVGQGQNATVMRYRFDRKVVAILVGAAGGLFDWTHPDLPEDLCLLRADDSAWLTTIAHEYEAWFSLIPDELQRLSAAIPELGPPPAGRSQSDQIARRKRRRKRR